MIDYKVSANKNINIKKDSSNVSIEEGRKAFYALRKQAKNNGLQNMSLDEINDEIEKVRNNIN